MTKHLALSFLVIGLSGVAYSQGSGLVQPLVSPLPSPEASAPVAAPHSVPVAGPRSPSRRLPSQNDSPPSGSTGSADAVLSPGGPSSGKAAEGSGPISAIDPQGPRADFAGHSAELDKWIDESLVKNSSIPQRVAFVVDWPTKGIPQFLLLDAKKFNQSGFFQTANAAAIAWDLKLNKKGFSNRDGFDVAVSLSRANIIIHSPKVGDWSVYLVKGDRRKPIAKGAPPVGTKEVDLAEWLTGILGWDGVVLDQRGHQLLVGSTAKILSQPQLQALTVEGSSPKIGLSQNERKGSGLLSLVYSRAGMGVFDIVFLGRGVTEIPVGTKLVIEKK